MTLLKKVQYIPMKTRRKSNVTVKKDNHPWTHDTTVADSDANHNSRLHKIQIYLQGRSITGNTKLVKSTKIPTLEYLQGYFQGQHS